MDAKAIIDKFKKEKPSTFRYSVSRLKDKSFISSVIDYTNFLPENSTYSQRLWHMTNDTYHIPLCPICKNENIFKDGSSGYTKFCSGNCEIKNKWLKTSPEKKKEIYKKQRETNKERYGDEFTFRNEKVKEKIKKTLQENYGENVINPGQIPGMQDRVKETLYERYGVINPGLTPQAIKARIERYGVENPFSSKEVQDKIKETNLEKYGNNCFLQSEIGKQKTKNTCIEKYGVEHPMQNAEIFEKATKHRSYEYLASNGKVYTLQGYEKYALEKLLLLYHEDDIIHGTKNISNYHKFQYLFDGKTKNYFPDFYIVSKNLIVEVKSIFSYIYEKEKNSLKKQAVLEKDVNFEFWIFDDKGNEVKMTDL
jgi:hypothetical protein